METGRRYFTESCQTIITHATITNGYILSVITITIIDGIYLSVFDRVLKYLPPCHNHRRILCLWLPLKIQTEWFCRYNSRGKLFFLPRFAVCKTVGGWFFLFPIESATEWEITEDQYFDGQIPSVRPLGKMLVTDFVPYTNGINPSVKLFNGVVYDQIWKSHILYFFLRFGRLLIYIYGQTLQQLMRGHWKIYNL